MLQATKLLAIPADLESYTAPDGMQLVVLNYKTDKDTQIKKPSEAWHVPLLSLTAEFDSKTVESAFVKFIGTLQTNALRELAAGDYEYASVVGDLELLCKDYITDNRGARTGPKQSEMLDYINFQLVPYMGARIAANLPNQTAEQKQNLLASFAKKFRIAATRGNKSGNETLSDAALADLQSRLVTYTTGEDSSKNLAKSAVLDALVARIADHRATIAKSISEVPAESF